MGSAQQASALRGGSYFDRMPKHAYYSHAHVCHPAGFDTGGELLLFDGRV